MTVSPENKVPKGEAPEETLAAPATAVNPKGVDVFDTGTPLTEIASDVAAKVKSAGRLIPGFSGGSGGSDTSMF